MTIYFLIIKKLSSVNLTERFDVKKGFGQGDSLSCDFFNIVLERIVQSSYVNTRGTIFQKSVQLLSYADDIDIIGRTHHDFNGGLMSIEAEAAKMGLTVNGAKQSAFCHQEKIYNAERLG